MQKTAVFVEGQTELIFVREFLLRMFNYENISLECFTLVAHNMHPAEYLFPNDAAEYHFQIVNAGSDQSVLTQMRNRQDRLFSSGFTKIIGLRDMYSRAYRDAVGYHTISTEVNQRFIDGHRAGLTGEQMRFSFAIMEIEAWLLGMPDCFVRLSENLTLEYIHNELGIDLQSADPETTFFHPAKTMEDIFKLAGHSYNKKRGDANAIIGPISKEEYDSLLASNKCASFKEFASYLLP